MFVYPSAYEGFGIPVLEAMACGTPVVTSNISLMPEIIEDAGILVDPNDTDQLATAIEKLLHDYRLHDFLKTRGLNRAQAFSWEKTALATLQVYNKVGST
jgi:glycosyltransferase involved in cell wall biosynthesis